MQKFSVRLVQHFGHFGKRFAGNVYVTEAAQADKPVGLNGHALIKFRSNWKCDLENIAWPEQISRIPLRRAYLVRLLRSVRACALIALTRGSVDTQHQRQHQARTYFHDHRSRLPIPHRAFHLFSFSDRRGTIPSAPAVMAALTS